MEKELTILQKSKRFFEPMYDDKMVYIRWIIVYITWAFDRIIHVVFLERLIHYLEKWNSETFYFILKIYLWYIVIYTISQIVTRKWGRTEISDTAVKFIQNIYLKKFINLNNTHIEKYWTGKLTAIINNWIDRCEVL